jgi:formate dehydrogenase iron-sulfur subunit
MKQMAAILIDTTRCTGCEKCVTACKQENGLGKDRPWRGQGPVDGLSSTRFCTILRRPNDQFVRQQCRHCVEPACVSACLVGAMQKTPEGAVIYDADRCMGCRYCMVACPYSIPRYDWNQAIPYVQKCTLCYHRLRDGKVPACVESCPEEAAIFGDRTELLQEARRRLAADPGKYVPRVYGEHEVGGTSVLYISDIPLGFLGCQPDMDDRPLPDRTWASLKKVPPLIVGVAGVMTGIHWIIGRRMKLAVEATSESAPKETQADDSITTEQNGKEDDD